MYSIYLTPGLWTMANLWLTQNYMTCPTDYTVAYEPSSVVITFVSKHNYEWFKYRWVQGLE